MIRIFLTFAAILIFTASTASAEERSANSKKFFSEQAATLDEVKTALEQDEEPPNLETLRQRLNETRRGLGDFSERLEREKTEIETIITQNDQTSPPTQDQDQNESDTPSLLKGDDTPLTTTIEEESRLDTINRDLASASRLRSTLDRLVADIAGRQRLIDLQQSVDERRGSIEEIHQSFNDTPSSKELLALREQLRDLKLSADDAIAPLRESRMELRDDLERLGPGPDDGAPELPEISAEREALTLSLLKEDAIIRQSDLNVAEIERLLSDITALRRDQFYNAVFARGPSPLLPRVIGAAAANAASGFEGFARDVRLWRAEKTQAGQLSRSYAFIALSVAFGFFLFGPARQWTARRIVRRLETLEPTPGRRAGAAMTRILARVVPGVIAGEVLLGALTSQGVVDLTTAPIARNLWFGFLALLTADAGATAAFAPRTPGWRLVPLHAFCGQLIRFSLLALVLLFFLDRTLSAGASAYGGTQELALLQSATISILMASVYFVVGSRSAWRLADGREDAFSDETKAFWRNARRFLAVAALAIVIAGLFGYVALAHYAATRIFMVTGLIALGLFIRLIAHDALHAFDRSLAGVSTSTAEQESDQERLVVFWIGVFLDFLIVLVLTPVVFLALGADWADVRDVVRDAFFGFKVGDFTISIAQIFSAIGIFVLILALTRFIQRTGEKRFFPRTRMDIGVQNSLKTLIGYVGLVFAFIAAVSTLGFNLSNLAIIAGALSVGIGFGLQSIVNNFVSGLILLFERPIKVGDWIVTSSGEGIVKNISVRSTEIETFDRSSVIVPNSELISSAVTNWTHKNKIGRLTIPVGVSYDSDPEHVIALLEEVGKESPVLLRYPEPFVYFDSFGDSALNLELRGYIRDVGSSLSARTALRVAIFKKLKEADVEIPFPQRDITIKSNAADKADVQAYTGTKHGHREDLGDL
ncbi:MAG: DUF3772 domain-containing protein [Pseudomonadota bacterium]